MALDGLGPDDIEVDGVMSQPSDPMPCKRTCSWVFAPIAFLYEKLFWKKFWEWWDGGMSGMSVVFIDKFSVSLTVRPTASPTRATFPF